MQTGQSGIEYTVRAGRPFAVSGVVPYVPILRVHRFILSGLDGVLRDMYVSDLRDVIEDAEICSPTNVLQLTRLSREFIRLTRPFFNVSISLTSDVSQTMCANCNSRLASVEDQRFCAACGISIKTATAAIPSGHTLNAQHEMKGFIDAIAIVESHVAPPLGTQTEIFQFLDSYFQERGGVTRAAAARLALLPNGTRQGTSVDDMLIACKASRKTITCYANWLCTTYWGWRALDMGPVRDLVISNHALLLEAMDKVIQRCGRKKNIPHVFSISMHLRCLRVANAHVHFRTIKPHDEHLSIFNDAAEMVNLYRDLHTP